VRLQALKTADAAIEAGDEWHSAAFDASKILCMLLGSMAQTGLTLLLSIECCTW
jgi:hypothetical protein